MSKPSPPKPPRPKGPSKFGVSTWIALGALGAALGFAAYKGRPWNQLRLKADAFEADFQKLKARNDVLSKAYEILQVKKFSVCNKSADSLLINWVAVVYHDGKQLRSFDSSRCTDWSEVEIPPGENKSINLVSRQEGCNWNGPVVYYAMRYNRVTHGETEARLRPFNNVGLWTGFDRDCYTVE